MQGRAVRAAVRGHDDTSAAAQPHNALDDLLDFGVSLRGRSHVRTVSITNEGMPLEYATRCSS